MSTVLDAPLIRFPSLIVATTACIVACSAGSGGSGDGRGSGGNGTGGSVSSGGSGGSGAVIGIGGTSSGGTTNTGGTGAIDECAGVSQQAENGPAPIDIIIAIDNSGSMTFEAGEVQNNMNAFAGAILNQGIDVHVAILSEDGPPNPFGGSNGVCIPPPLGNGGSCTNGGESNPPVYLRVPVTVNSSDSLQKLLMHYQDYKPILRQKSLKYFAVVTDDNSAMDAFTFIQSVGSLDPGWFDSWKFFGVFCDGSPCTAFPPPCAETGTVYADLVSQTAGTQGSLCQGQSNFSGVFSALAQTIYQQTELACEWDIPPPPPGEMFEKNKVNVRYTPSGGPPQDILWVETAADCGPQGGWYYDNNDNPTKVQVCSVNCDVMKNDINGVVDVLFGCFTIQAPK